jgi:cell fate regulator YaaT (PSP1 superfamily)
MVALPLPENPEPPRGLLDEEPPGQRERAPLARVVRYGAMGFVGEFSAKPGLTMCHGAKVVIQTDRGIELGEPIGTYCEGCGCDRFVPRPTLQNYIRNSGPEFCKPRAGRILRVATPQDVSEHQHLNAHVKEDIRTCAELAAELHLDIRIVTAEHLLGGERIVFYFGSPARVDFRQLVRELASRYRTRIEMRQVGARDEARLVADYEVCGRECCCTNFLKKLRPVNMKMAKLQKSTLDPSKVSGRCGRLRCCLRYEHLGYEELEEQLPRLGSRVGTEFGAGTVVDRQILTQLVMVRMDEDENRLVAIPVAELTARNLPPLPRRPAPTGDMPAAPQPPGTDTRASRGRGPLPAMRPPLVREPEKSSGFVPETPPVPAALPEPAAEAPIAAEIPEPPTMPECMPPAPDAGAEIADRQTTPSPAPERRPGRRRRGRRRRGGHAGRDNPGPPASNP